MRVLIFVLLALATAFSCNKNDDNCNDFDATYEGEVKKVIERSCNNGTCHIGTQGWKLENVLIYFDSYENMLFYLENGRMEKSLFDINPDVRMPPSWAEDRQLTMRESEILRCWFDSGFPEN